MCKLSKTASLLRWIGFLLTVFLAVPAFATDVDDALAAINAKDYAKALRLLRPGAEQGQAQSQSNLGYLYQNGLGVPRDYQEAVKWYRLAAAQGSAYAQRNLGTMYRLGQGVAQDYAEAMRLFKLAASRDDAQARNSIGVMHTQGQGVPVDHAEAHKWYRQAAAQGNAAAQMNLGVQFRLGRGVAQNYEEALKLYRLAAAQNDGGALSDIGFMYREGQGVPKSDEEAAKWFKLSADQGHVLGQRNLADLYESGKGVPLNYDEAARLYLLSAAQGNTYAKSRLEAGPVKEAAQRIARDPKIAVQAPPRSEEPARVDTPVRPLAVAAPVADNEKLRADLERQRKELERDKLALEQQKMALAKAASDKPAAPAAPAVRKVALVIGNATYRDAALKNPVNDARAMAQKLRSYGYEVLLKENIRSIDIGGIMAEFASRITPGAEAIFFYAGHGVQLRGENFFPTVDAELKTEFDMPTQSISLNRVLDMLADRKAGLSLVLLDACRNNPFLLTSRSVGRGMAPVNAASGTLLSYATRPGSVANDGDGANGVYTTSLLKHIDTPNLPVEMLLKRIASDVKRETKGAQEPWTEGNIEGDFMFVRR